DIAIIILEYFESIYECLLFLECQPNTDSNLADYVKIYPQLLDRYLSMTDCIVDACKHGVVSVLKHAWMLRGKGTHSDDELIARTAIKYGHLDIIQFLQNDTNINFRLLYRHLAIENGNLDLVKFFYSDDLKENID